MRRDTIAGTPYLPTAGVRVAGCQVHGERQESRCLIPHILADVIGVARSGRPAQRHDGADQLSFDD